MTKVKLSILKGGPSSGNFGHAGRPGKVGGSAPGKGKGGKKKVVEKPSIFIDSYDEVRSTKRGSKGYFITGDNQMVDVIGDFGGGSNDHVGAFVAMEHPEIVGLTKDDAKKFEKLYTDGDPGIMDYWEKIHKSGVIRVREFGKKVYIDTYEMNRSTLRRIQGLMDEGKIRFYPGKENVWASSDNYWDDVRFTYADIIDADDVDIDGAKLKEETKMAKLKVTLKGGPGSGHHGHAGRPGKVGGSAGGKGGKGKRKGLSISELGAGGKRRSISAMKREMKKRIDVAKRRSLGQFETREEQNAQIRGLEEELARIESRDFYRSERHPDKRGGPIPGDSLKGKFTAPSSDAFLKAGVPGRGGKTKLPKGWRRSGVDKAKKTVTIGDSKVTVHVSFFNGYYASVGAEISSGLSAGLELDPGSRPLIDSGTRVEWGKLQSFLDNIDTSESKQLKAKATIKLKGGGGSGHFGHAGRPGSVGGSTQGNGGKKKVGVSGGAKRRAAAAEKRKADKAAHQKKYGKPTGKGTTADGLAAIEYAFTYARPTPGDMKHVNYKVLKNGVRMKDIDGYMGNAITGIDAKYLESKFGFTPKSFGNWLGEHGATQMGRGKAKAHYVHQD